MTTTPALTLGQMADNIRKATEEASARCHYRITWIDGVPHVQRCPVEIVLYRASNGYRTRPGTYAEDGEIVRRATPEDMKAMYAGRIHYDSETEPGRLAWEKHVREGGD